MTNQEPIPFKSIEDLPIDEPILVFIDGQWLSILLKNPITAFIDSFRDDTTEKKALTKEQISRITHWMPMPPVPPKPLDDAEAFRQLLMMNTVISFEPTRSDWRMVHPINMWINANFQLREYIEKRRNELKNEN